VLFVHLLLAAATAEAGPSDAADARSAQPGTIVFTGTRPPTDYLAKSSAEVSQSVQVITRGLIDDQAALSRSIDAVWHWLRPNSRQGHFSFSATAFAMSTSPISAPRR
jgi:hypothetical protein